MKKSLKILAILSICSYFFLTSCVVSKKLLIAVEKERDTCQANMRQCQENFQYLEDQLDIMTSKVIKGEKDLYEMTVFKNSLQVKNDTLKRIVVQLRDDSVEIVRQYDSISVKLDSATSKMFEMGQFIDSLFFNSLKLRDSLDSCHIKIEEFESLLLQEFAGDESESENVIPEKRKNVVLNPPSNNYQKIGNTGKKTTVVKTMKKPVQKKPALRRKIIKKK